MPKERISARKIVILGHKRWQIENQGYNELVNHWHADHVYKHDANAILVFLMLLFIAYNILNVFYNRNLKDPNLKRTKIFVSDLISASLLHSISEGKREARSPPA